MKKNNHESMKGEYIDLLSQSFGQWSKYFVQVVNILSYYKLICIKLMHTILLET